MLRSTTRFRTWLKDWTHSLNPSWAPAEGEGVRARIEEMLAQERIGFREIPHVDSLTASELAESIHIHGRAVAKVVLVWAGDRYVMAVLPANRWIDLEGLAAVIGADDVSVATEHELRRLFPDCELGAMPPFGNLYGVDVYVDSTLATEPVIFFPIGSHHEAMELRYVDYAHLVQPKTGRFSYAGGGTGRQDVSAAAGYM